MIFCNTIIVSGIYFYMGHRWISSETTGKEQVAFPKIGDLFQMLLPILNSVIEKVTYFLILSNFAIKAYNKGVDIGTVLKIFFH